MNDGTKGTLLALSPLLRYLRKGKSLIKKILYFIICLHYTNMRFLHVYYAIDLLQPF